jgi:hypothetical protein
MPVLRSAADRTTSRRGGRGLYRRHPRLIEYLGQPDLAEHHRSLPTRAPDVDLGFREMDENSQLFSAEGASQPVLP